MLSEELNSYLKFFAENRIQTSDLKDTNYPGYLIRVLNTLNL